MFCYTIMKLFISLLENVNKSRTSTGNLSFTVALLLLSVSLALNLEVFTVALL
jgi:hypothetical protein